MSTPNAEIPAPASQPSGDLQQPGQLPNTPVAQPNQPSPTQPASPQAPAAPQPDALAQAIARAEKAEKAERYHQSRADQVQHQLRAVTGAIPPVDPLAEDVAFLQQKGYDANSARDMAEFMDRKLRPIAQENHQLRSSMQGTGLAHEAYQAALNAEPELFRDPKVAEAAWKGLNAAAQAGQLQYINPDYAVALGSSEYAAQNKPWKTQSQQPPMERQPLPNYRPAGLPPISFGGPPSGYPPQHFQQQPTGPTPEANKLAAEMGAYLGIPPKQ